MHIYAVLTFLTRDTQTLLTSCCGSKPNYAKFFVALCVSLSTEKFILEHFKSPSEEPYLLNQERISDGNFAELCPLLNISMLKQQVKRSQGNDLLIPANISPPPTTLLIIQPKLIKERSEKTY